MKQIKYLLVAFLSTTLVTGCRSNADYSKLALAGSKYLDAVDLLLAESTNTKINLTSEEILANDRIGTGIDATQYQQSSAADLKRITSIDRITKHNLLLKKYFSLLLELANSDAPQTAQVEVEKVAKNITQLGAAIRGGSRTNTAPPNRLLGSGVNFIVKLQVRQALKQELEQRGNLITNELTIQAEALEVISKILLQDKERLIQFQENRFVIRPIIQDTRISNEDEWIKTRERIMTMNITSEKFQSASSALNNFKNIFQSVLEGKSDLSSIDNFLGEVETFTKLVVNNR